MRRLPTRIVLLASLVSLVVVSYVNSSPPLPSGSGERMRAIVYHDYGTADVLRLEEIAKPRFNDDQVLIKVRAASANPLDWHFMRGTPYLVRMMAGVRRPNDIGLGVDLAGQVEAVGKNVTKLKVGDEVFGVGPGSFAEYVRASPTRIALKPANLSFEQAAAVPVAALTALQALRDKGRIQPGQKVLINGASGGVGTFAVQIAKTFGAEVTGVCSTRNLELVRSLGADHVVDYTKEDFTRGEQRYDLILDNVGNHALSDCRRVMSPKGIYVMIGGGGPDAGRWIRPFAGAIKSLLFSPFVSQQFVFLLAEVRTADLNVMRELIETGKVTPVVDRTYPLSEVPEAIRYLEQGHARGKVVITVEPEGVGSPARAAPAVSVANASGSDPVVLAVIAVLLAGPVIAAFALNRRFRRRNPGKRAYRWGYYFAIQAFLGGIGLGVVLESGIGAAILCGIVYAILAWFFAARRHWAWIALTVLSFNPVVWILNPLYFRRRWAEDSGTTPGF